MTPRPLPSWQRSGARSEGEKDETPSFARALGFPTDHLGGMEKTRRRPRQGQHERGGGFRFRQGRPYRRDDLVRIRRNRFQGSRLEKLPPSGPVQGSLRGKKENQKRLHTWLPARRRRGWRPGLRGLQPNGLLAGMPGQTVRAGLDLPAHRRRDPRFSLPDNRGRGSRWQIGFDRQFGKTGGHPLPQFHRLAPSPPKAEVRNTLDTPCICGQRCAGRLSLPGVRRRQPRRPSGRRLWSQGWGKVSRRRMVRLVGTRKRCEEFLEKTNPFGQATGGLQHPSRRSKRGRPRRLPGIPGAWQGGPLVQGGSQFHQGRKVQPGLQADRDRSNHRPSALPRPRRHGSRR